MRPRRFLVCRLAGIVVGGWGATSGLGLAQELGTPTAQDNGNSWQRYDWLAAQSSGDKGETFRGSSATPVGDPGAVIASGQLWQEKYGVLYTRRVDSALTLSCETSDVTFDGGDSGETSRGEKVGFDFSPADCFTLRGDCHGSSSDAVIPTDSTTTSGASLTAVGHLPNKSTVTLGMAKDQTATAATGTQTGDYDAQLQQPVGSLPLSAVLKSRYAATAPTGTATPATLPSLEQSLVWKPMSNATVQMGLRQQQYQEYPGVDHQLNEALFADWSQQVLDNVSWHSYAEVLNSRGLIDQAPASSITSGSNGTAQANNPLANTSPTSSLPLSLDDQTLTFSTGPSVQLQKDLSASFEYSNRWDKNPASGNAGEEQRVSVSVKGSF